MTELSPRQFALDVTRRLQQAGYQALWAGGCVRDELMGHPPTDYDVATSALPDQVRQLFGQRRTLSIGAAFGVITVLGPKSAGQLDVATFRSDGDYSDGRHPDAVTFSDARHDAERRDFTINGLFYDPVSEQLIDYVGGREDLDKQLVRAIGDPHARIAEDKLRMLRAVRFAATFQFALDEPTRQAMIVHASEITLVSAERIGGEVTRMLGHENRAAAIKLLQETGLMAIILPESVDLQSATWQRTLDVMNCLDQPNLATSIAALTRDIAPDARQVKQICRRWRLSNDLMETAVWILGALPTLLSAPQLPWPRVQRVLVDPRVDSAINLAQAIERSGGHAEGATEFCRERLGWPAEKLDPPVLINGDDLQHAGLQPGPLYTTILQGVRDAQLLGEIKTHQQAMDLARQLAERVD